MGKPLVSVLGVALVAAIAAGCGEDEQPPSNAAYIKQGDAICKRSGDKIQREAERAFAKLGRNEQPKPKELEPFVNDTLVPEVEGQLEQLRDLTPPKGDDDEVAKIYAATEKALGRLEEDPSLVLRGDPFTAANRMAKYFGFKVCGE